MRFKGQIPAEAMHTSNSRLRRRISSRLRGLMSAARKRLLSLLSQSLTPMMQRTLSDAQFSCEPF